MELLADTARLNALVDATAKMIGEMLSLRDDDVSGGRATLGEVLYEEQRAVYTSNHEKYSRLGKLAGGSSEAFVAARGGR